LDLLRSSSIRARLCGLNQVIVRAQDLDTGMSKVVKVFSRVQAGLIAAVAVLGLAGSASATVVQPTRELNNLRINQEREAQFDTPAMLAGVAKATADYQKQRAAIDSGRDPNPNPCTTVAACLVDPRYTVSTWQAKGGIVKPVLYTARSGATLSGHVWATKSGPKKRPAIVIINGSIIGYEQIYWIFAQALAKAGFVVMTFDAQGEGMSDQFGEAPDSEEGAWAGTPVVGQSDQLGGSGKAFYDGGEDTVDFLLSTPKHHYQPVPSRTTHTSHDTKQKARVRAGLDAAYDPLWRMVDRQELGVAGHSYGAEAASWLLQHDSRLKTAVAWDDLCRPVSPAPSEIKDIAGFSLNKTGWYGLPEDCFGAPAGKAPKITKPALGLSADYFLNPQPYLTTPPPEDKSLASLAYTKAGVDTGQIIIRGGTHYDFDDYPNGAIPASRRGINMVSWYTVAWFEKYLQHKASADKKLLTRRWQNDPETKKVDPSHDGNEYSFYYKSRLDIHLANGRRYDCENLRTGCKAPSTKR
jgi:dienelactone hydrolase